jgi:glutamate-1-semialdehyde aminotransferase
MARFGKSGSDATTGAVRAARAFTGREMVLHCGNHGWHDWYIAGTTRNKGVPQGSIDLQAEFPYNDLAAVTPLFERHPGKIAVVIMEPYRKTPPEPGFLEGVKN